MSDDRDIKGTLKGFTPVIDAVTSEVGARTALVFGRIWRYCQMSNRVCTASQAKIADDLGLSRQTINKHIRKLCEAGYLRDLTPDRKNRPHVYQDTGKVYLQQNVEAITVKKLDSSVTESDSDVKKLDSSVKKLDAKKESKIESRNPEKKEKQQESDNANSGGQTQRSDSSGDGQVRAEDGNGPKSVSLGTGDPQRDQVDALADVSKIQARDLVAREMYQLLTPNLDYPDGRTKRAKEARRPFELAAEKVLEQIGRENYQEALDACYELLTDPTHKEAKWIDTVSSPHGIIGMVTKRVDQRRRTAKLREAALERNIQAMEGLETIISSREPEIVLPVATAAPGVPQKYVALWENAKGDLELQMARATFNTWLRNAVLLEASNDHMVLQGSKHGLDWVNNRLRPLVERAVSRTARRRVEVEFVARNG